VTTLLQLPADPPAPIFREETERAEARIFGEVWVPDLGTDSPE
jgi:hypothetical protein